MHDHSLARSRTDPVMRYIIIAAVALSYIGTGVKHGFALSTAIFGTLLFLAYLAWALDAEQEPRHRTRHV